MVWNGTKANVVNNVMIEHTTAVWSRDGLHPPSSLPSRTSEALPGREAQTRHGEIELEIVIIDKHFPYDLVCPASRKLQGCRTKLSTEATDFISLQGAAACAQPQTVPSLCVINDYLLNYTCILKVKLYSNLKVPLRLTCL